jgi:hypothetical protein
MKILSYWIRRRESRECFTFGSADIRHASTYYTFFVLLPPIEKRWKESCEQNKPTCVQVYYRMDHRGLKFFFFSANGFVQVLGIVMKSILGRERGFPFPVTLTLTHTELSGVK